MLSLYKKLFLVSALCLGLIFMARATSVRADQPEAGQPWAGTIQAEGFAISGEFGASVEVETTDPGEGTFVTPAIPSSDQLISPETTFQTLAQCQGGALTCETEPSAEGTFTTPPAGGSQPNGGGEGGGGGNGGGGGGGHSSGGSRRVTPAVISVAGYCPVYLTKFIHLGRANDPAEVLKLQRFLRDAEGFTNVPLSGFYDLTTYQAVMAFQTRYAKDILTPWGINHPTGYVYITTTLAINNLHCERDPKTTLDLRFYRFTSTGIEVVPANEVIEATSTATTTLPFTIDESEMGVATPPAGGSSRFFLAALGVFNFFKQISAWWWIFLLLLIIFYLAFELNCERRRHRPKAQRVDNKTDLR